MRKRCLLLAAACILCAGLFAACGAEEPVLDLNEEELLTTKAVVSLLNEHGYEAALADNPSEELSSITVPGAVLSIYEHDNEILMMYEYGDYPDMQTIADPFIQRASIDEETRRLIIGDTGLIMADRIQGKNIAIIRLTEDMSASFERFEFADNRYAIADELFGILFENAFNGQEAEYSGENENWEVVVQVFEYDNRRFLNEKSESDEFVNSIELFNYKHGPIEDAAVSAIKVSSLGGSWSLQAGESEILTAVKMGDYWCYETRTSTRMGEITIELTGADGTEVLEPR